MKEKGLSGYLTVYLALVLTLLLSLCLSLIEGARSNAIRLEAACVADAGINSVFAEYHRELLRQYNLFAIDSAYGTGYPCKENTVRHLEKYINRNFSMEDIFLSDFLYKNFIALQLKNIEVTGMSVLTDEEGAVFRQCAVDAVKADVGIDLLEHVTEWTETITGEGLLEGDIAAQKRQTDAQIQEYDGREIRLSEEEWITIDVTNPTDGLEQIRSRGILDAVIAQPSELSTKAIVTGDLIGRRLEEGRISQGNIPIAQLGAAEQLTEHFFFQEYLLRYLGSYRKEKESGALSYQIEYLLVGKDTDLENLKGVADRLCMLREAANALYLFSDESKCAQAEMAATALATLFMVPEIAPLLKTTLLLGWAYAESLYDVKTLLAGGRIPLIKDASSWHYGLEAALAVEGGQQEETASGGLSYEDYLRAMMLLTDTKVLTGRAMDMVEADIRLTPGNAGFRLDGCYDGLEVLIEVKSAYGYEYEIAMERRYSLY